MNDQGLPAVCIHSGRLALLFALKKTTGGETRARMVTV